MGALRKGHAYGTAVHPMVRLIASVATLLALSAAAGAQGGADPAPPYCADLQRVTAAAASQARLAALAAKARQGDFSDVTIPLTGWNDCSLYGARTYTCDSRALGTAHEAEQALEKLVAEIRACLGTTWAEVEDRSSPSYVVLHGPGAVSITISTDQTGDRAHVVRLTLFRRGSQ